MANLVKWQQRSSPSPWPSITLDQLPYWFGQFGYQGLGYGPGLIQTIQNNRETISADFTGFINGAFKTNGAIFACILTRLLLFSEARFQFRRMNNGRPGKLFGTPDLDILENPWPNATTGDLLGKAIVDIDLAGNFYAIRTVDGNGKPKIARLRPDWVTIILGSMNDPSLNSYDPTAELIGYIYTPGGPGGNPGEKNVQFYLPEQCMHCAPIPDPIAHYRGMSWVQPILSEVLGDRAMNAHKLMYFEQGATPNLVVSLDTGKMDKETFAQWVELFENEHGGALNAYKTLYLGMGASATVVGSNLKDLDYAIVQGHTETRIAAAAGIPPIIVGFSEGLESATYSNYGQARRAFADKTLRPLWRNFCSSISTLVPAPPGSMLWYDDRDIQFLKEDQKDMAEVQSVQASAMSALVLAGYDADSVVDFIAQNDVTLLKHTGLVSVQMHPPGTPFNANVNGNGNGKPPSVPAPKAVGGSNLSSADERAILQTPVDPVKLAKALIAARAGD